MIDREQLTGVILAGGQAQRMKGLRKGLQTIKGRTMISLIYEKLRPECAHVFLNANKLEYESLGISLVEDEYKDLGPAGGIYSALKKISTPYALVVACDLPFITNGLFKYLKKNSNGHAITIPKWKGQIQPLCGIYSRSTLPTVHGLIKQDVLQMQLILKHFHVNVLEVDDKKPFYVPNMLDNINTIEQLRSINS